MTSTGTEMVRSQWMNRFGMATATAHKADSFFSGKPCTLETGKPKPKKKPSLEGGLLGDDSDPEVGRCDILLLFDDDTTFGDVVETFQIVIASGFTSPRWVPASWVPKVKWSPPSPPPKPETGEVDAAHKKLGGANANVKRVIKDQSSTADQIKAATGEAKRAEEEYKAAKKKATAARVPSRRPYLEAHSDVAAGRDRPVAVRLALEPEV